MRFVLISVPDVQISYVLLLISCLNLQITRSYVLIKFRHSFFSLILPAIKILLHLKFTDFLISIPVLLISLEFLLINHSIVLINPEHQLKKKDADDPKPSTPATLTHLTSLLQLLPLKPGIDLHRPHLHLLLHLKFQNHLRR